MKCNIQNAKKIVLFLLVWLPVFRGNATGKLAWVSEHKDTSAIVEANKVQSVITSRMKVIETIKAQHGVKKGWALLILLLTGPLGGHRIYLGSPVYIPLVYTATIGGGFGILPLLDAIAILFTNDLSKFINNDKIIMWIE